VLPIRGISPRRSNHPSNAAVEPIDPKSTRQQRAVSPRFPSPLFAQQEVQPKVTGIFSTLKAGQAINVKETGERYLLTVIEGESKLPQSHAVLEVGQDFVAVKDFTGLNETRIPITSVKAVVHFKGFERK
jgi:hypothetical protein